MESIDFVTFKNMLIQGRNNLHKYVPKINKLNVFPVPDGDTGTNMFQTINAACKAIEGYEEKSFKKITKIFSKTSLMEACGNSGVIFSQFFKGFATGIKEENITIKTFIKMFTEAKKYTYTAVKNATEGTILTLVRVLAEKLLAKQNEIKTFKEFFTYVQKVAKDTIADTPNYLQVLKDANVVDSGAFGLGAFIDGMIIGYNGQSVEVDATISLENGEFSPNLHIAEGEDLGYCTELVLRVDDDEIRDFNKERFTKFLQKKGNSSVVVLDEEILKIHIHTLNPGNILNYAQKYGPFVRVNIKNMTDQVHENKEITVDKENIVIVVSSGSGLREKFEELGADFVISGGQSINPKTKDFIDVINKSNAKNIIIMPNNKNVYLAAKQVQRHFFLKKKVSVLDTKSMWQGINCLMNFDPDWDHKTRVSNFNKTIKNSFTFEITNAIKNFSNKKIKVKTGDYIAILDGEIVYNGTDLSSIFTKISTFFANKGMEFVFIAKGEDAQNQFKTIHYFEDKDMEVEEIMGHQKSYSYIIGGE